MSSGKRIRGFRFYLDYEYGSETKDQIEDLLTMHSSTDEILTKAISVLHEQNFGSISKKSPPPSYSQTFTATDDTTSKRLDELWGFIQTIKEQTKPPVPVEATQNAQINHLLSDEQNEKILKKIDELGMRFSKILPQEEQIAGQKTTEMSKEEVLKLIKRIDQLESKLTRAISQSRVAAGPVRTRRGTRDLGEPPKIAEAKPIDGPKPDAQDRPLLDDVLDTVIVSVEKEE